jgi:hypothetical protein
MPEYLAELVFDEWTKKKNLYDADRLMAEVEKAMEKMSKRKPLFPIRKI